MIMYMAISAASLGVIARIAMAIVVRGLHGEACKKACPSAPLKSLNLISQAIVVPTLNPIP